MEQHKLGKKHYRCHAHTNPFKDTFRDMPRNPDEMEWGKHFDNGRAPDYIDVGCGYGRFLMKTAELRPEINILGLEIRDKVVEFVRQHTGEMKNCSVIKTNALLFLPNYFQRDSLSKIFILFPDPHFKKRKQKGRIVCRQMMGIFRYLLKENGRVYISTDVKELFDDMCRVFDGSGFFSGLQPEHEDPLFDMCYMDTDEAHRAGAKTGHTFGKIYRVGSK